MSFKEINIESLQFNPFTKIGSEWMLLTAGDETAHNTMTASWGFMGVMWGMNIAEVVIRPSRYTYEFFEKNECFTISFYESEYKNALTICGTKSGRDCDKEKEAGLTPCYIDGTTAFEEASMVLVCRKVYVQDMDIAGLVEDAKKWYSENEPMHKAYYGEIVKVLVKE